MEQYNWSSIDELFDNLNQKCNYLVLRNYENMQGEKVFLEGHEDIDFLCDDLEEFVKITDARTRRVFDNHIQYYILLKGCKIKIDVRHVGDDYYDVNWQKDMLDRKKLHELAFYVMNDEDYFYSLIYHAILQKKKLSEDYKSKLIGMARNYGTDADGEASLLALLEDYMVKRNYVYSYPLDTTVPNRFFLVDSGRCRGKMQWNLRKVKHIPYRVLSFCLKNIVRR